MSTEDISWLTPAQVRLHYFNGHCEGKPLSPIVRARVGEEGGGGGEQSSFIQTKELSTHSQRTGGAIIIQLRLFKVNNAQSFIAQNRGIIGNQMPGDFSLPNSSP